MKLIINKPRIEANKLISTIEYDGDKKYDMFFEVRDDYVQYLADENANAFLVALIPFIVKHNYDVEIKAPVSTRLYFQVTSFLLPLLCREFHKKPINIECELTDKKYDGKAVGASVSCGIDSFYTILKHRNCKDENFNITHLCFFNAGSNGSYGGEKASGLFEERVGHIKEYCEENNFPLVTVNSNMNELIMMDHKKRNTFTTLSCVYALEKLFGRYYFASCVGFNGSHISDEDTADYDVLNVYTLSNENITFYCTGMETDRMDKVKYVAEFPETFKYLNVCIGTKWENCGNCLKCIRTMTELESIGKLDCYSEVFDLEAYKKNRSKVLAKLLALNRDSYQHAFCNDTINMYKKNGIKIPFSSRIRSVLPTTYNMRIILRNCLSPKMYDFFTGKKKKNLPKDGWMD